MIIDPIQHIPDIAASHNWDYEIDKDGQANVNVKGDWNEYSVSMLWNSVQEILITRSVIPTIPVPTMFEGDLTTLINIINGRCMFGSWYYQDTDGELDYIVWRHETHAQIEHTDSLRVEKILTHTRMVFDTYYPALIHFLTQRVIVTPNHDGELIFSDLTVTVEEAIDQISYVGEAKGRA